ncbi:MAG: Redoxin domain protein, partial [Verrucomicrobiales bacterium]|nr:Redoxin domain protein [Verrucomicrobiales bacterium]
LHEGDAAPKLYVSKWVQGEPVKEFKPGTVYIVEFWATWWTPCKEAISHVNRLHNKFKDKGVVVIGQNAKQGKVEKVEPFIKQVGSLMTYRVALDDFTGVTNKFFGKMVETWLTPAEEGIPIAFVIDKQGKIAFIGHPDDVNETIIDQLLAGTFDTKKRALEKEAFPTKAEAWDTHNELGKAAWKAKQWGKAMSEVDELEKIFPQRRIATQCLRMTVFIGKEDFDAASKLALRLSNDNPDDPFLQHRVAKTIANRSPTNTVILEKANLLMDRANALLKGPEPEFLHTQARLAFLQGKKEKAIQLETEAMGLADSEAKVQFALALEGFKQGKLPQ